MTYFVAREGKYATEWAKGWCRLQILMGRYPMSVDGERPGGDP